MISSESTNAFGQPRDTKPTDGVVGCKFARGRLAATVTVIAAVTFR